MGRNFPVLSKSYFTENFLLCPLTYCNRPRHYNNQVLLGNKSKEKCEQCSRPLWNCFGEQCTREQLSLWGSVYLLKNKQVVRGDSKGSSTIKQSRELCYWEWEMAQREPALTSATCKSRPLPQLYLFFRTLKQDFSLSWFLFSLHMVGCHVYQNKVHVTTIQHPCNIPSTIWQQHWTELGRLFSITHLPEIEKLDPSLLFSHWQGRTYPVYKHLASFFHSLSVIPSI